MADENNNLITEFTDDELRAFAEKRYNEIALSRKHEYANKICMKIKGEPQKERKERISEYIKTEEFETKFTKWIAKQANTQKYKNAMANEVPSWLKEEYYNFVNKEELKRIRKRKEQEEKIREKLIKERVNIYFEYLNSRENLLMEKAQEIVDDANEQYRNELTEELTSGKIYFETNEYDGYSRYPQRTTVELTPDNIDVYWYELDIIAHDTVFEYTTSNDFYDIFSSYLKSVDTEKYSETIESMFADLTDDCIRDVKNEIEDYFMDYFEQICYSISDLIMLDCLDVTIISEENIMNLLSQNPHYMAMVKAKEEEERLAHEAEIRLEQGIIDTIPDNPIDLYPLARRMKRKWILHIGPTNSGKTHDAMQALENADTGIYLAPLRLLAFEGYSRMNNDGVPCSLITGEEESLVDEANHTAATIEMLDTYIKYDVAVIDEAQMIGDRQRGGAWTTALLGVRANTIHICAAPYAKKLLLQLAKECGDEVEITEHKRETTLVEGKEKFNSERMADSVQNGDALIVFSKKNVLSVAATLQKDGVKCSVIYGSLPYEVRQNEAERFANGETTVVVATDAIGMGMNLPIRRVVFLEQTKFDGYEKRMLLPSEVQQIAGRAGRRGMFDEGYYTTTLESPSLRKRYETTVSPLKTAYLGFDKSLINIDEKLSKIMKKWIKMQSSEMYKKQDLETQIKLCEMLEECATDKELIYKFVTIPFNSKDTELLDTWYCAFRNELNGMHDSYSTPEYSKNNLQSLEEAYSYCDLMYYYLRRFTDGEQLDTIIEDKKVITKAINKILAKQQLKGRKCEMCNKPLPWNYPYSICQKCHDNRYDYYDYWD